MTPAPGDARRPGWRPGCGCEGRKAASLLCLQGLFIYLNERKAYDNGVREGLKEVPLSNFTDAESLVSRGMLKRSAECQQPLKRRSQCIITIRGVHKRSDADSEHSLRIVVLTIADLAGAEQERETENGSRLLESNFINNTSLVFGLCLRSLLEHQKNQKKPLEKHFKNSMEQDKI